ncbi:TonB-dependent receptor plug domain-containing protein [Henriciella litoralis]|uniref:TonB-dependent receptor plug domain-containing protein n=1 Tax=Henriciella litoralis TaxID=568102 RepID=UPI00111BF3E2|nr:TonB-dependent receptor [Henriciella litoralis]
MKPNTKLMCTCSAMVLASMTAQVALAQGEATNDDERRLSSIEVIGVTLEETLTSDLERYGSDVETITSEELRNESFTDVSSALQMKTPGLFLAPRGGPFSYIDISLQGSRTQDILFLVDGVRINNRLYSGTITDTLPSSMVERVEVVKGGQGLFYGTQAAAGVINVVTRGYTDEFDGLVEIGADTNGGLHADGYIRGAAGPGNYVLYASHDEADGFDTYTKVQPSVTDRDRSYEVTSFGGKYRLELSDTLNIDARYQHNDAALDYSGARLTAFAQNDRDEDIASFGLNYDPSKDLAVRVKAYWHDWDTEYTTINNVIGSPGQTVTVDDRTYWGYEDKGINILGKYKTSMGVELVGGYDFQQYSGRDDVLLIEEQEEKVHAVFGQVRTTEDMFKRGALAAGVRYNKTGDATATVWNLSGRYDLTDSLFVEGIVGTSFLLPTAYQLYAVDPCCSLGNPELEAEESENANISFGGRHEGAAMFSWQITGFARNIDNLISSLSFTDAGLDPTKPFRGYDPADFNFTVFSNVEGQVKVKGVELSGSAAFSNGLNMMASYTRSESEQESGGITSDIQRIPRDYAKIGLSYQPASEQFGLSANALWTGEQVSSVTGFGTVNYGDYVVVDLSAHVFIDAEQRQKVTMRLENALDEDYITRPGSALVDGTTTAERFYYGNRGVPQTFHISYSLAF